MPYFVPLFFYKELDSSGNIQKWLYIGISEYGYRGFIFIVVLYCA